MMNYHGWDYGMGWGAPAWLTVFGAGIIVFVLWSLFWKGLALWHAAQRKEPWWFIIFLIINTAGVLEIIYLFLVAKLTFSEFFSHKHHHT